MTSRPVASAYRAIYRAYRQASRHPRPPIPAPINAQLKSLVNSGIKEDRLETIKRYLISSTLHQELVRRYNPADDLTEPERLKATVNRVGLSMPKPLDPDTPIASARSSNQSGNT